MPGGLRPAPTGWRGGVGLIVEFFGTQMRRDCALMRMGVAFGLRGWEGLRHDFWGGSGEGIGRQARQRRTNGETLTPACGSRSTTIAVLSWEPEGAPE